jgi:hypothetical protein
MRYHRDWSIAQIWSKNRDAGKIMLPENLVMARISPVVRRDIPGAMLELRFESGKQCLSVPFIYIDELALFTKLRDVCIWPEAITRIVSDRNLAAVESAVYPWVEHILAARGADGEQYHLFTEGESATRFIEARKAGLFGAASFATTTQALSLAQYASRFVSGAHLAASERYLNAGVLCSRWALSAQYPDLSDEKRKIAEEWFGFSLPQTDSGVRAVTLVLGEEIVASCTTSEDVRVIDTSTGSIGMIVNYVPPLAVDDLVRFGEVSTDNSSLHIRSSERPYAITAPEPPISVGGSEGRILILVRRDILESPGADNDEAEALASCLSAEGFHVEIASEYDASRHMGVGLIHAIGLLDPEPVDKALGAAKKLGVPVVVTPHFEDSAIGGRWGARASRSLLASLEDESEIENALNKLATRHVDIDGATATSRLDDGLDALRREVLRRADVVTVCSDGEREAVQRFSGRRRRTLEVPLLAYRRAQLEPISHLVPDAPYVLLHAGVEARHNLGLVMRALRGLELPVVMIAAPVDRRLTRMLQAMSTASCAILPSVTQGECEAIYARAAVYVDAAWYGDGLFRIGQAAARGLEIVVADSRYLPEALANKATRVDAASVVAIQTGITDAWQRSQETSHGAKRKVADASYDPASTLSAYGKAYAQAGEHLGQAISQL